MERAGQFVLVMISRSSGFALSINSAKDAVLVGDDNSEACNASAGTNSLSSNERSAEVLQAQGEDMLKQGREVESEQQS